MLDVSTVTYVYAVTWAAAASPEGDGVCGGELTAVEHRDLAAIVSAVDAKSLRPRRRDVLRHAEVVQETFERGPVVPLRFGAVLASPEAVVEQLLEPRYEELSELLRRFDRCVELTVRAFYREQDVLRAILAAQPRLARLRGSAPPLELGGAVASALAAKCDEDARGIVAAVGPLVRDIALDDPRTELEVLRGALLLERDKLASVDAALEQIARVQAETTVVKVVGPLPPHHFVGVEVSG